jgi:hypothetical protein
MIVSVVMVVVVVVSQPFSVRMSRYMVVVMYVVVSMLLHDSFYSVFLHCIHMLHYAAPFCKGTYCGVFRTAADVFQISDFFSHFNSPFLAPALRDWGTVLPGPVPDIPFGIRFNSRYVFHAYIITYEQLFIC